MEQYDSPYIYVGNNPISFIDPSGMFGESINDYILKTVYDARTGRIIYYENDPNDNGIYVSFNGEGSAGNTDGMIQVGTEEPGVDYSVGRYINFIGDRN